jgi:hypothetical protein
MRKILCLIVVAFLILSGICARSDAQQTAPGAPVKPSVTIPEAPGQPPPVVPDTASVQIEALKQQLALQKQLYEAAQAANKTALDNTNQKIAQITQQLNSNASTAQTIEQLKRLIQAQRERLDKLEEINQKSFAQHYAVDQTRYESGRLILIQMLTDTDSLSALQSFGTAVSSLDSLANPLNYKGVAEELNKLTGSLDFNQSTKGKPLFDLSMFQNPYMSFAFSLVSLVHGKGKKEQKRDSFSQLVPALDFATRINDDLVSFRAGLLQLRNDTDVLHRDTTAFFIQYHHGVGYSTTWEEYRSDTVAADLAIQSREKVVFAVPVDIPITGDLPPGLKALERQYQELGSLVGRYTTVLDEMDTLLDKEVSTLKTREATLTSTTFTEPKPLLDAAIANNLAAKQSIESAYRPHLKTWRDLLATD